MILDEDLRDKLNSFTTVEQVEQFIKTGKFNEDECIIIDNFIEESSFISSKEFDRLYCLLADTQNYGSDNK